MRRFALIITLCSVVLAAGAQDAWRITASPGQEDDAYFGATIANGQIGVVSSADPLRVERVVLGGVYDIYGRGRVANFVHGINMLNLDLRIDGSSMKRSNVSNYRQTLDMAHGAFIGEFDYKQDASVRYVYRSLRHLPYCTMLEVEVMPYRDLPLRAESTIEIHESLRNAQEYFTLFKNGIDKYAIAASSAETSTGAQVVGASTVILTDTTNYPAVLPEHWSTRGVGVHSQIFEAQLKKGKPYKFYVVGTTMPGRTAEDVRNEVERMAAFCTVEGAQRLIDKHNKAWSRLWESDIIIEGDPQAQQDVRAMLFNLYGFVREGSGLSVSPMGLSGFGYNGHVFWDCETWVYPVLLVLKPELARTWIDYRFANLEGAKRNAYQYGCLGAKYPWESAGDGREETPSNNLYGQLEVHVSADVAIAAWQYYQVTHDKRWLARTGYPIIRECAAYFVSRADKNEQTGGYDLINVISADEWNVNARRGKNVDNNAYTNGAVKTCLRIAVKAAALLDEEVDPMWSEVAEGLPIREMKGGITREHDSYIDRTKTKQADVALLSYPLSIVTDRGQMERNLEYYLATVPRKSTPAMSKSVYSILYSILGNKPKAWHYFVDSYRPNMQGPFGVIAEFDGGTNPYFITGAGGALQSVMMGFGGLRITDDGIVETSPALPAAWKSLTLKGVGVDKRTIVIPAE